MPDPSNSKPYLEKEKIRIAVKANVDADAAVKAEVAWRVESGVSLQLAFVVLAFLAVAEVFFNLLENSNRGP